MLTEVEWGLAPADAGFYAEGYFRNFKGDWWSESYKKWGGGGYSMAELLSATDYQKRPETSTKAPEEATQWTAKHYDNYYQLTPKDIESGKVKIDAYFVNKLWQLNSKDDTGALFHCLKTIARFGDKNPVERELNALHNQVKRMAELYGVVLK
jgi:hypothetical protein